MVDNSVSCSPQDFSSEVVFLSPWVKQDFPVFYARLTALLDEHGVWHQLLPYTNDYWCRDFMPFHTADSDRYLLYRYAPDYLLEHPGWERYITDAEKVCQAIGFPYAQTDLVLDGGNMVQAGDYLIMTEKIFKENPDKQPQEIVDELEKQTGLKLLLLPWDKEEKYGHADGIVHAVNDRQILMTNYADFDAGLAAEMVKRLQKHFEVLHLKYDVARPDPRNWAYINYLDLGNLIVVPALGIAEDAQAIQQIRKIFPHKKTVSLRMEEIINQGGALNCISWTLNRKTFATLSR